MSADGSSPTKRPARRSKADIAALREQLYVLVELDRPMTVRQVFYRAVSAGIVDKTEGEYKSTVCRLLTDMRLAGELPFSWIADNTRWMRKPTTYTSWENALENTAATYRRAMWADAPVYVEVWLEKDALAGVLLDVTRRWDVPLMVTRGYPSLSYLTGAADYINEIGKPCHIYYFGDFDPSGVHISQHLEERLRSFVRDEVPLLFERVAVNEDQIAEHGLPTRPTKRSDSRAKHHGDVSVEVDAFPPATLRSMAEDCISAHVDHERLDQLRVVEREERQTMQRLARREFVFDEAAS